MIEKKKIVAINGSASRKSSNYTIIENFISLTREDFTVTVFDDLSQLPHFRTEQTDYNVPEVILQFREAIAQADGVVISTPEYVFSIPSRLKNALEWCVSTTVFSNKTVGLITASANGEKGHEELQLILKTLMANVSEETSLIISGIRAKIDEDGRISDEITKNNLIDFVRVYVQHIAEYI